jgi:DNA-binding LacI/PurR family transcriptional regulator
MAEVAVRTAIERLDDHSRAGTEVVLDPELVVRGTTAAQRG